MPIILAMLLFIRRLATLMLGSNLYLFLMPILLGNEGSLIVEKTWEKIRLAIHLTFIVFILKRNIKFDK